MSIELVKISELPLSSTGITPETIIPVVQGGDTVHVTQAQLKTFVEQNSTGGSGGPTKFGFAVIGDSISQAANDYNLSWPQKVQFFGMGKHVLRLNPSVGGYTVEQIRDILLPQVLALNPLPRQCVISGGTNNTGSDANVTSGLEALDQIIAGLVSAGVEPVLWTIPPQLSTTRQVRTSRWNNRVWTLSRTHGFKVLDSFSFFQVPATGLADNNLFSDDLHPNDQGYSSLGKWVADQKVLKEDTAPALAPSNVYPGNLISNPWFLNEGATPGMAVGWSKSNDFNGVMELEPDPAGFNWQVRKHESGTAIIGYSTLISSLLVPNNRYAFSCLAAFEKPLSAEYFNSMFSASISNSSWATLTTIPIGQRPSLDNEIGLVYTEFTAPAGAQNFSISIGEKSGLGTLSGDLVAKVARPYLLDLTAAGLA